MKKPLILVLVMALVFVMGSARQSSEKVIKLDKNREKRITYYPGGAKKTEIEYKDGIEHGKYSKWYESGEKEEEGELFQGKDHGVYRSWYKNGKIKASGKFDKGTGNWTEYYPNGKKQYVGEMKNGLLHGKFLSYYETGKLEGELFYKAGKRHGLWTIWDKAGNKFSETRYENDKITWENEKLKARLRAVTKARYKVIEPAGFSKTKKYPLLFLLHGRGGNLESIEERWKTGTLRDRFLIVLVQSSQFLPFPGCFSWDDIKQGRQDMRRVYEEITAKYPVDRDKVIIAGMSAGGKMSIDIAVNRALPVCGFIACCPPKPDTLTEEAARQAARSGIRGTIIAGEKDSRFVGGAREMAALFKEAGLTSRLVIVPGMGHSVPGDSHLCLEAAIAHILEIL